MTRCVATTKVGTRCKKASQKGKTTCFVHRNFVMGGQTQAKIVDLVQKMAHSYVTISEMKQRFCHAQAHLSEEMRATIDAKEKRLDKWVKQLERLARKCGTKNVETQVDKLREKFNREKRELFSLILEHCKRRLSPAYVIPDYPPSQEVFENMMRRDGETEQRYVKLMTTFFTIFMRWAVMGVVKTPVVLQWLAMHYVFTFVMTICLIIKFPQQIGKRIPVVKELIGMIEALIHVQEEAKQRVRDLKDAMERMQRIIFAMVSRILKMKLQNPLRLLADRIHKIRGQGTRPMQIEQAQVDLGLRLWQQQTGQKALPMPDNVFLAMEENEWPFLENEQLISANYDTWPNMDQSVYSVVSIVGMMLLFVRRIWR